jgi:hypothetical protein
MPRTPSLSAPHPARSCITTRRAGSACASIQRSVREKDIIDGDYHIHWLAEFLTRGGMEG